MNKLGFKDILILGIMNFAFFVGAGNIIFPPFIGLQAGTEVWSAAFGFLLTGVGLPVLAAVAMARAGGNLAEITQPLRRRGGAVLSVVCYLCIGPLFATPRTATVSYELAFQPLAHGANYMWLYSLLYFLAVIVLSLYPGQLLNVVGKILAPLKTVALFFLALTALLMPSGQMAAPSEVYAQAAFSQGIVNGYLTMDTLASLVFGLLIVNALRSKGINSRSSITQYAAIAGMIAGGCLVFAYLGLFRVGTSSAGLVHDASNGTAVLSAYVNFRFGMAGRIFLDALITVACFVTAVGLTCSCGSYFSEITPLGYPSLVWLFGGFSMIVSNLGLTELIKVSAPVLTAIYPLFIVLIAGSFFRERLTSPVVVIAPVAMLALLFGVNDGFSAAGIAIGFFEPLRRLPLFSDGVAWLLPCVILFALTWGADHLWARRAVAG